MWYARGLWPTACLLVASVSVAAQTTFHNDGNAVYVGPGAVVYVAGGVNNHNDGTLANGGTFHFEDDWSSNTAASDDVASLGGTFVFEGDYQDIRGSREVRFPRASLSAASVRARQLATDVAFTVGLDLAAGEWSTGSNIASVVSPEPAAITRTTGYVSSDSIGGYLSRVLDRDTAYLFPVGSTGAVHRQPVARYRPVAIRPTELVASSTFAVRFGNVAASDDDTDGGLGYDLDQRDPTLTEINRGFYHYVDRLAGTAPAEIEFYFDENDGRWSTVAQRQDPTDRWDDAYGEVDVNTPRDPETDDLDRVATLLAHDDFTQPLFALAGADADDDGVPDRLDLDADNDGIANVDESPSDPYADHDGDGYFDYLDADFPGCGPIVNQVCFNFDQDLDGRADHLDLDSDGDGIADINEAAGTWVDLDMDAQVEYVISGDPRTMVDVDLDGFADAHDHLVGGRAPDGAAEVIRGTPWPQPDRDGDGLRDFQDIDSDGDGIVDWVEGQATMAFAFPAEFDGDLNGIDLAFDFVENGRYGVVPHNTDGVDQPDYLDLNSDNERTSDLAEAYATDATGLLPAAWTPLGLDSDGDGLDDRYDNLARTALPAWNAANGDLAGARPAALFPKFQNPAGLEPDFRTTDCKQQDCRQLQTTRKQP